MKDDSWVRFGNEDPYFAVLTQEQYKSKNLSPQSLEDFFKSGEDHVEHVINILKNNHQLAKASFKNVLDFGCGTGRLVIPFASCSEKVLGIDISKPMLEEAQKNLLQKNVSNVELLQTDDLTKNDLPAEFDFVHTFIVLQHIPVNQGYGIIDKLVSVVCDGGYGMIHFTFSNKKTSVKNAIDALKSQSYIFRGFNNLIKGKAPNTPVMQMNNYSLERVFKLLLRHQLKNVSLEFTDHGGFLGVCIYFKK